MNIKSLHDKLNKLGIQGDNYYLHGLYGSKDDNNKLSLVIFQHGKVQEYKVYFKEKGNICSAKSFDEESKACRYLYQQLINDWLHTQVNWSGDMKGMTANERLFVSGLDSLYQKYKRQDEIIVEQIFELLDLN